MRACSTVVFQLCPLPWTSSRSKAPGLNQNPDALLKALDGEHESRLLKKTPEDTLVFIALRSNINGCDHY